MNYEIVYLEEKMVEGITARTNNHASDMGMVIGGLWNRFYQEGVYENIKEKADRKAIGLYTEYAGGVDDDYTIMVCCAVDEKTGNRSGGRTAGCEVRKIPAGRYARFKIVCDMRTSSAAVSEAWQEIWETDLPRTYICDFEEYQNEDMRHAEVHIYIGLKEDEQSEI